MKRKDRSVSLAGNVLTIRQGEKTCRYSLSEIGTETGRFGFQLDRLDGEGHVEEVYHCELFGETGFHACDCRGFVAHSHCKHVSSLLALIEAGKLGKREAEVA